VIARQRDGQLRGHFAGRPHSRQDLQDGGRLPPRLAADAVGPHARRARPPRLLAPVPGGYAAGDRGRGAGAHWPPPSAGGTSGRGASSGEVPGAGGSALVTAASAGEPLTTPTGQTGSGNSTGGAAGGGTRSTSRRPSAPVRMTRSPSACILNGWP